MIGCRANRQATEAALRERRNLFAAPCVADFIWGERRTELSLVCDTTPH